MRELAFGSQKVKQGVPHLGCPGTRGFYTRVPIIMGFPEDLAIQGESCEGFRVLGFRV